MDCFEKFDPLEGNVPLYPFFGLFDVAWKARELLKEVPKDQILWIEKDVDYQVERVREYFYNMALERVESNNEADLEKFEEEYEEPSEVEALSFATDVGWGPTDPEEPGSCPVKCAAVLALMLVASCVETLECPEEDLGFSEDGPIAARLISAANSAFDAALAFGLALKYERHIEITNEMEVDMEQLLADFNKDKARRAALRKHGPTNRAKAFVIAEWAKHKSAYSENKSAFARDYVRRVHNEYQVSITEKQMREVWLKDTPSASKPDGVPADG
jgi:hypothetical protein